MIVNVSGRTDIVAFYTDWFMNRYREGFVDVRNPVAQNHVSRIYFKDVDALVFCTKNPTPLLPYIKEITHPILFQLTLTGYKKEIEPGVLDKTKIIESLREISKVIGVHRTQVRYDPIFLSENYSIDYHCTAFERMCELLEGVTQQIIVSFIDEYKNVKRNKDILNYREFTESDYERIGKEFSEISSRYGMTVQTCAEERRLIEYGFIHEECISKQLAQALTGKTKFKLWSARNNKNCQCVEMVDIGSYNSCLHYCKYCYANYDERAVLKNYKEHNPKSTLLIGELKGSDILKVRIK